MENKNELDNFLRDKLSIEELNLKVPQLSAEARKKIIARKKPNRAEVGDLFSIVAAFLNLKIKLYHAVLATVIIGGTILFFTKEDHNKNNEGHSDQYVSNVASVKSSTVLSSINTFGLNKERSYANGTN